jgi:hypothetical protein
MADDERANGGFIGGFASDDSPTWLTTGCDYLIFEREFARTMEVLDKLNAPVIESIREKASGNLTASLQGMEVLQKEAATEPDETTRGLKLDTTLGSVLY